MICLKIIKFQVTEQDIEVYASLSGDYNQIHLSQKYAQQYGFSDKIAHGMLTMAKIWSAISSELSLFQWPDQFDLSFISPVYAGDQVTIYLQKVGAHMKLRGTCQHKIVVKGTILLKNQSARTSSDQF